MRYRILAGRDVIGETDLENCDPSMGVVSGIFHASADYGRVQGVFRIYSSAAQDLAGQNADSLTAYYTSRDALELSVETKAGRRLPADTVHILDFGAEIGELFVEVYTDEVGAYNCDAPT